MAPVRALATLVAGVTAVPATDDFLQNWMGNIRDVICNQTILDLTFPGTHDTMTYDLSTTVSAGGIDGQDQLSLILSTMGNLTGNSDLEIGEFMRGQAHTQALTVTEQLDAGIRFLDFRIMLTEGDWYNLHMVRTNSKAITYLQEVRAWMDNHPTEIVLIWLSKHGSECATGENQYPNVTVASKQAMWQEILVTFDGLVLDTSVSSLAGTSFNDLLARNHRLAIFASDYVEFTGSSTLATDGCLVDNPCDLTSLKHENLKADLNYFAGVGEILTADKKDGKFFLLSMAGSQPDEMIEADAMMKYLGGKTNPAPMCAAAFHIPGMTNWCPETLLNVAQLANYYKQQTLDAAYNAGYSFPNAIYIDAVGPEGTIRTGSKLLSAGADEPVCDIFTWTPCKKFKPRCPKGSTLNGEQKKWGVVDDFGTQQGICILGNHWKCCRNSEHTEDAYAYADTLIAYNVRKACNTGATSNCESVMSMMEERRAKYPVSLWSDESIGRLLAWPETTTAAPTTAAPAPAPTPAPTPAPSAKELMV